MGNHLYLKTLIRINTILIILVPSSFSVEEQPQFSVLDSGDAQDTNDSVQPATVNAIDGTRIEMLVSRDGKAVTVAEQDPQTIPRKKRKKHSLLNGNPVDEPLSIGLINITSLSLVEDAQPEISNTLP